jgi:hypothetical protein
MSALIQKTRRYIVTVFNDEYIDIRKLACPYKRKINVIRIELIKYDLNQSGAYRNHRRRL